PIGVIAEANNIRNPRLIRVGQTILVPNKWNRGFKSTANYPIGELVIHLVRRGETLSHIARKYGTTVSSIMRWNNLKSAKKIFPNQRLKVYAGLTSKEITPQIDTAQINNAKKDQSGRYIIHKVRRGENLWLISRKYGVTISSLMKWNNIRYANRIKPGQPIKVYLERVALSSKKNSTVQRTESKNSSTNETIIYKVKKGDSLWSISKKYGVSIENIKRWNNLKYSNRLMPGDELRINLAESDSSESSSTKVRIAKNENESTGYIIHKVKKGETLWVIAKRYGVSIANIMEWNNIRSARKLRPSQKLKIYKKEFLSS
ncbi:MAG: LysM peptidoglycan-binding domain-containing protein, partial [Candidatus Schekmanbacteria bacterium]